MTFLLKVKMMMVCDLLSLVKSFNEFRQQKLLILMSHRPMFTIYWLNLHFNLSHNLRLTLPSCHLFCLPCPSSPCGYPFFAHS